MQDQTKKPIPMLFQGGPTYMTEYLKDGLRQSLFTDHSYLNINSNTKEFKQLVEKARDNLRSILDIPNEHQIWFLSGGCHLQFAGLPLNFLGTKQDTTANYTTTGHFSRLSFRQAKKYCKAKSIIQTAKDEEGYLYLPEHYDFDPKAAYTHFVENESVEGISYSDDRFPVVEGIPLFNDCSSSFLTRSIDWNKVDMAYAHAQKNCGISGLTVMILNKKSLETSPRANLPQICSFQNYKKNNGLNAQMNILSIYSHYIYTQHMKSHGGLHMNKYKQRAQRLYDVIDKHKIYKAWVKDKALRSDITVTWRIQNEKIMQECFEEGAKNGLYEFKGHRALGGLRAALFCPIPDESVYRLADFLEDFAQKYE